VASAVVTERMGVRYGMFRETELLVKRQGWRRRSLVVNPKNSRGAKFPTLGKVMVGLRQRGTVQRTVPAPIKP
jgi:hypothetical protein